MEDRKLVQAEGMVCYKDQTRVVRAEDNGGWE